MGTTVDIAGVKLEHPLMNGPGTCKTLEDVEKMARSAVSAVNVGSVTITGRPFNPGNTFWSGTHYALNSLGMPNPGLAYYREHLPAMVDACHTNGKPFILNVAGFSAEEYAILAAEAHSCYVDFVELNLGCPNVWDEGQQKRIASFYPGDIRAIVQSVDNRLPGQTTQIGVKLSPYSNPAQLDDVAKTLLQLPVAYIATCNTFPNTFVFDEEGKPAIGVHFAGLSGEAMKPVGLGQVKQFRQVLGDQIPIVGLGGILTGQDMEDYLHPEVGADAVAATTVYWRSNGNPNAYGDILAEYAA